MARRDCDNEKKIGKKFQALDICILNTSFKSEIAGENRLRDKSLVIIEN